MRAIKMRHCFFCGEELGAYADYDPLDTCGKRECERKAQHEACEQDEERRLRDFESGDWR